MKYVMLYKALPVVPSYLSVDEAMRNVESSAEVVSPFKVFTNQRIKCICFPNQNVSGFLSQN